MHCMRRTLLSTLIVGIIATLAFIPISATTTGTTQTDVAIWFASNATPQQGQSPNGSTQVIQDFVGSQTQSWEVVVKGTAPASLVTVIQGCMRGGTCGSATQSTNPASNIINTSGLFDNFQVTVTWTGGDATTSVTVNDRLSISKAAGQGGGAFVTYSGSGTYAVNAPQYFAVSDTLADLWIGCTSTDPSPTLLAIGMTWCNMNSVGGFPHIIMWDGNSADAFMTQFDSPCSMANGCTGDPTQALVSSLNGTMKNPNLGDATASSIKLNLATGDFGDLGPGVDKVVTGSLTSGTFIVGEPITQGTTNATATAVNSPAGSQGFLITPAVGSPDNSHTWVGTNSGAVYTPNATPATPFIQLSPAANKIRFGYGSNNRFQLSNNNLAFSDFMTRLDTGAVYKTTSGTQTGTLGAVTMVAATPSGTNWYSASAYGLQIAAGTSCTAATTLSVFVTYTDPTTATSQSVKFAQFNVNNNGTANTVIGAPTTMGSYVFPTQGGTAIQYSVTYGIGTGCAPGPTYQVTPVLWLVQ